MKWDKITKKSWEHHLYGTFPRNIRHGQMMIYLLIPVHVSVQYAADEVVCWGTCVDSFQPASRGPSCKEGVHQELDREVRCASGGSLIVMVPAPENIFMHGILMSSTCTYKPCACIRCY